MNKRITEATRVSAHVVEVGGVPNLFKIRDPVLRGMKVMQSCFDCSLITVLFLADNVGMHLAGYAVKGVCT